MSSVPIKITGTQASRGGGAIGSWFSGAAIRLSSAVRASWTIARLIASTDGANLLISTICRAKATAQPRISHSPIPKLRLNWELTESKKRPSSESVALPQDWRKIVPRTGRSFACHFSLRIAVHCSEQVQKRARAVGPLQPALFSRHGKGTA
jgi:hypothetical protein